MCYTQFSYTFGNSAEERGGDPVPVVSRSLRRAKDEQFDVVIIDTSGRLSNNFELTQQLIVSPTLTTAFMIFSVDCALK